METFSRHPYDLTVIAIDSDSTAHSTVTCKYVLEVSAGIQQCFAIEHVPRILCPVLGKRGTF